MGQANCGNAKVITAETKIASFFCIGNAPVLWSALLRNGAPCSETWPVSTAFRYKLFMVRASVARQ